MYRFSYHQFLQLQTFLFAPKMPLWRFCLIALLVASVPSIFLTSLASITLNLAGFDISTLRAPARHLDIGSVVTTVVFGPIVETIVMSYILAILSSTSLRTGIIASISALMWGIFHGLFGALWFFGTVWAFFVMSCAYLFWRKFSYRHAFLAAAVPHALNNLIAMSALALPN